MSAQDADGAGEGRAPVLDEDDRLALAGARQAARDLVAGSRVLWGMGWGWVTEPGGRASLERLGYTAAGGYLAARVIAGAGETVQVFTGPVLIAGWFVAAAMYSPDPDPELTGTETDETGAVAPSPPPVSDPVEDLEPDDLPEDLPEGLDDGEPVDLAELVELVAAVASRHGHQGAHLADLLEAGDLDGWTVTDLRTAFAEFGVPVADQLGLKFPGRPRPRNRPGVRLRDLPQHLLEVPAEAGEGPPSGGRESSPDGTPGPPAEGAAEGSVDRLSKGPVGGVREAA